MHRWWVFLHLAVGVSGFLATHGVSIYVTFRVRREREAARVIQLLELSASTIPFMWASIGILVVGGILAGFTGQFWGQAWIWAAIGVLVAVIAGMYALATPWVNRLRTIAEAMVAGTETLSQERFEDILRSRRPHAIAAVGLGGLVVIFYLMMLKPGLGLSSGEVAACPPPPPDALGVCAVDDERFDPELLEAPADEPFEIVFANEDEGIPHNVAIYADESAEDARFVGDWIDGPRTVTYEVPALEADSYYFRCDVHPIMDGTLEVA